MKAIFFIAIAFGLDREWEVFGTGGYTKYIAWISRAAFVIIRFGTGGASNQGSMSQT